MISSSPHIPWKRFWSRFGETVHMGDQHQGFLTDPEGEFSKIYNPHLFTIEQLLKDQCLILCGDPGMGKSTEIARARTILEKNNLKEKDEIFWLDFRAIPNEGVFARRTFESERWVRWQNSSGRNVLIIDGVDEGLIKIPGFISYLAEELRNFPLERLQLILVCRSAEWPTNEGAQLINFWGLQPKHSIFELCPLRQRDAVQAAQIWNLDGGSFNHVIHEQKLTGLAARPTTLFFLLGEYRDHAAFAQTHRELYERGCQRLAREHDSGRIENLRLRRQLHQLSTPQQIHEAARRIACLFLICGRSAIHIGSTTDAEKIGQLHMSEAADSAGPMNEDILLDAISSGLFTSHGPDTFGFAHQTFAECLAAQFLSGLDIVQIRSLLCARDGNETHVIPQLAETAAWVAGTREDFFDFLCKIEPEALLRSDISKVQNTRKRELVAAILEKAKRHELYDDRKNTHFLGSLKHPHLTDQLRPYIINKSLGEIVRRFAFQIATQCKVEGLCDDFLAIIRDDAEPQSIRDFAAQTLQGLIPSSQLHALIPLATGQVEPDPNDTIRGSAIRRLVPEVWSVSDALPHLPSPRDEFRFSTYHFVLGDHLPACLKAEDLPAVMPKLLQKTHCFGERRGFQQIAESALVLALNRLHDPEIRDLAVRVWITKAKARQPLPSSADSPVMKLFTDRDDFRRDFVTAMVNHPSIDGHEVEILIYGHPPLFLRHDFEWALGQIHGCPVGRRTAWANLVAYSLNVDTAAKVWDLFLERLATIPELAAKFTWMRAWGLDETEARQTKALLLKDKRRLRKFAKSEFKPDIERRIQESLDRIASGKPDHWIDLCYWLSLNSDKSSVVRSSGYDVIEFSGWKKADENRRTLIRSAARNFLLRKNSGFSQKGERTNFDDPGYIAIWLLRDAIRNDSELKKAVAKNWINAIIGQFNNGNEHYQESARLAYELNPEETLQAFSREIKRDDECHGQIVSIYGFRRAWDHRFTSTVLNMVRSGGLKSSSIESILRFVGPIAPVETGQCAQLFLDQATVGDGSKEQQTIEILAACLGTMPTTTWQFAWPIIDSDDALAEKMFLRLADRISFKRELCLPLLTEKQLANLYLRLHDVFPAATDPDFSRGGQVSPRQGVVHFRGDVIETLAARGTEAACAELLRLANSLPEESVSMRWRYYHARLGKRRISWSPPLPNTVLTLASLRNSRHINDSDDLMEIIVESLERLQTRLTRTTLPRSEDMWHWEGADTRRQNFRHRDEAFISNYIASWLRDDLSQSGIVIGREVQIRIGQRTDIYVVAPLSGNGSQPTNLTVVIEVKGCWNAEVRTAIEEQLVGGYLRVNGHANGIYLVGWFVCDVWDKSQNRLKSASYEDAKQELGELASPYDGKANLENVRTFLLDCRYPSRNG